MTEVFVVKALMLYKFPNMNGLDESFMSRVLFMVNLGFILYLKSPAYTLEACMNPMNFKLFQVNYFLLHNIFLKRFVLSWSKKKIEDLSHCLDVNRNDQKSSHFYWCIPGMLGTSRIPKKIFLEIAWMFFVLILFIHLNKHLDILAIF